MTRGSRKHVLDWTALPRFPDELIELARPVSCRVTPDSIWQPMGHHAPREARVEQFGPRAYPGHPAWPAISSWWLKHARGANTPNWDIALSCEVEGRPGLILVEAKANVPELGKAGKRADPKASVNSTENHEHIKSAIETARNALMSLLPGISIASDKHYQLSNRIAFAWKLASEGIPTVLIYLGFTGDQGIADAGKPFADDADWQSMFKTHLSAVCPPSVLDAPVNTGASRFWVLARSLPASSQSPSKQARAKRDQESRSQ